MDEFYKEEDLRGKSLVEVADMIVAWREDEDQMAGAAFDLLNAIEDYLRTEAAKQ